MRAPVLFGRWGQAHAVAVDGVSCMMGGHDSLSGGGGRAGCGDCQRNVPVAYLVHLRSLLDDGGLHIHNQSLNGSVATAW